GSFDAQNARALVDAGAFIPNGEALRKLVVGVQEGRPVRLDDVAEVIDGPAETQSVTRLGFGPAAELPEGLDPERARRGEMMPAVHLAVAKKKGTNAVRVAEAVEHRMEELAESLLPEGVYYR